MPVSSKLLTGFFIETNMEDLLKGYPSLVEQKIAWGDMDAAQHINNTVYFRYFESGRIAYFDEIGFSDFDQVGPILAETSCRYRIPLVHPDTITIATRVQPDSFYEFGFVMEHIVVSHQHQQIAAKGTSRIVSYDYMKKVKAPLPQTLKDKMLAYESK